MNTSLTTYFKYPSELRSRKRKLSPERGVLADITNSTPKRYAVSISNRSTGVTKQFTRMDPMNKREVCAVLIMQLKGNSVYLNAKMYFSGPVDLQFLHLLLPPPTFFVFTFFPSCLLPAFLTQCTTPLLLPCYTNRPTHTLPYMMQQFFPHNLLFLDYPEFGNSHLFLNVSNCLQLIQCYNHTSTLTAANIQCLSGTFR